MKKGAALLPALSRLHPSAGATPFTPKEPIMKISSQGSIVHNSNVTNYIATDPLERDKTQSVRLHEPAQIISSTDPITGRKITDLTGHPYLVDGNVTIYFETEATRQEFMDMPIDHPFHLVDNPTDEGYDEG
jgi:YHS domain-containing protein